MKSDLEKRLEYVRSQREILQRTEEELQKQLDAEKQEFDFKSKMPVGSVWLGIYKIGIFVYHKNYPEFAYIGSHQNQRKTIYHAHQIVKAAQEWKKETNFDIYLPPYITNLTDAIEAAEQDGVLQNLE